MSPRSRKSNSDDTTTYTAGEVAKMLGIAPITMRSILAEYADEIPSVGNAPRLRFPQAGVEKIKELRAARKMPRGRAAAKAKAAAAQKPRGPGRSKSGTAPRTTSRATAATSARRPRRGQAEVAAPSEKSQRRGKGPRVISHRVAEERAAMPRRRSTKMAEAESGASGEATAPAGLLTLKAIERATLISYPTLMRYAKDHSDLLPSVVVGARRYYYPQAVEVVRELRSRSKAGRKPGAARLAAAGAGAGTGASAAPQAPRGAAASVAAGGDLAGVLAAIEARLAAIEAELRKPLSLAVVRG